MTVDRLQLTGEARAAAFCRLSTVVCKLRLSQRGGEAW